MTRTLPGTPRPQASSRSRWPIALISVAAVVLVGLNLRAGIASAGPLFHDLQIQLGYGPLVGSLLPTIPVLCFAVAGAATAMVVRRIGMETSIAVALLMLTAGLAVRAAESTVLLLVGTVLGMSGLAVCNVAMPTYIRQHHPGRAASMTGMYTVTMTIGATTAAAITVPVAQGLGSPTLGLAAWALPAAVGFLVFLPLALHSRQPRGEPARTPIPYVSPWRMITTRKGLLFTGLFAAQSFLVYGLIGWYPYMLISQGLDPTTAGLMLGLLQLVGVPTMMVLLTMAGRPWLLRPAFMITCTASVTGYLCLLFAPVEWAPVTSVIMGVGFCVFPLLMLLISKSGETAEETTALSTLAQSLGYLVAAVGPFGLGLMNGVLGDWTAAIVVMLLVSVAQLVLSHRVSAPTAS
ncbi:MFS transporter [Citricoccus sp. GCM10030269]|uniref:MFS transporter n=1 Tax=Citricoccus sp. GCM10030269 TaxID=3273388 RepID=UPI0036245628